MFFVTTIILWHLASFTLFVAAQSPQNSRPSATIDTGPLIGTSTQPPGAYRTVNQFLGIPFAQPPLGNLRFSPPKEVPPWKDGYEATSQPNACMQYMSKSGLSVQMSKDLYGLPPPTLESEDCLYLNVYTPSDGSPGKAVLFWIYGGSGTSGAASQTLYDGTSFAANQDIIVVVPNYRVNGKLS
jgi:carboxylesterase type B